MPNSRFHAHLFFSRRLALGLLLVTLGCAGWPELPTPLQSAVSSEDPRWRLAHEHQKRRAYGEAEQVYRELLKEAGDDPRERARALTGLGEVQRRTDRREAAIRTLEEARGWWRSADGNPTSAHAATLSELAKAYEAAGDLEEAEALHQEALEIRFETEGAESPMVASSLHRLALLQRDRGAFKNAEKNLQRALKIRESRSGTEHPETAAIRNNLGLLHQTQGDLDRAEQELSRAADAFAFSLGPDRPETGMALLNLSEVQLARANFEAAEVSAQRALAVSERVGSPANARTARALAVSGRAVVELGRSEFAEQDLSRALEIWEQAPPANEIDRAEASARLARIYADRGDSERAASLISVALARVQAARGAEHPMAARLRQISGAIGLQLAAIARAAQAPPAPPPARSELALAREAFALGKIAQAEQRYRGIVDALEVAVPERSRELAHALSGLADCAAKRNQFNLAEARYLRAAEVFGRSPDANPIEVASTVANLGALYVHTNRHEQALPWFQRAEREVAPIAAQHPDVMADVLFRSAVNLSALERRGEAIDKLERSLSLREHSDRTAPRDLADTLDGLGALLLESGELARARQLLERAAELRRSDPADAIKLGSTLSYLGRVYAAQGDPQAAALLARSLQLIEPGLGKLDPLTLATRASYERVRSNLPGKAEF